MNRVLRWGTVVCYLAALTVLLVRKMPLESRMLFFPNADKVAHFLAFGLLATLILRAMTDPEEDSPPNSAWITAILVSVGYGVGIEFIQGCVGRDCSFWDMVADTLGVLALTGLWAKVRQYSMFFR